jgi:lipopolysaccharide/colanic/teichoic acid biosynthesis glycosyltransferase
VFGSGLVAAKTLMRVTANAPASSRNGHSRPERIVVLGANNFASLYIKLLQSVSPTSRDVVAVLDSRKELVGRSIEGVHIVGLPEHIDAILTEYSVHGIVIDRVVVAGEPNILSPVQMIEVTRACERRQIAFALMPQLLGLNDAPIAPREDAIYVQEDKSITLPDYFKWKRLIDFTAALVMIIALLPMLVAASILVLFDLGAPILFWQQRLGVCGSTFLLFKFRTLRPPFNWLGQPIGPERRLSRVGQVLRETSIDELPQLLNVLIGDMSLIGPRPLLPEDQPLNPAVRLMVRPGITGWAQIHGGKLLTAQEKDKLDEWYVQNASIWVDLEIVWKTVRILLFRSRAAESLADFDEIKLRGIVNGPPQTPDGGSSG